MLMKSVEFILPETDGVGSTLADFLTRFCEDATRQFGGYTRRAGRRYERDTSGTMQEENISIIEVIFNGFNLDGVTGFAAKHSAVLGLPIEVKFDGETIYVSEKASLPAIGNNSTASDWPTEFDIAIQTVIGSELHAVQDCFGAEHDRRSIAGTIFYRGHVKQRHGEASVVICCQSSAGNDAAALIAERLIQHWSPKAIFLLGIAAGRRGKCKIGDVVTPRMIIDDTEGVLEAGKRLRRPQMYPPPHAMIQQLQKFRLSRVRDEWHSILREKATCPSPPQGQESEYVNLVACSPSHHDAAIYSSDLLLRTEEYLTEQSEELHQQIKIGEMEAAGFGTACSQRSPVVPWFVVRGVSDFGDSFKDDAFHDWAAMSAATYLYLLIREGISLDLF